LFHFSLQSPTAGAVRSPIQTWNSSALAAATVNAVHCMHFLIFLLYVSHYRPIIIP